MQCTILCIRWYIVQQFKRNTMQHKKDSELECEVLKRTHSDTCK